jgi:hypothetical protein
MQKAYDYQWFSSMKQSGGEATGFHPSRQACWLDFFLRSSEFLSLSF